MALQPHELRVEAERDELHERIVKLGAFMDGDLFKGLPTAEQDRMRRQHGWMCGYRAVLAERIAFFHSAAEDRRRAAFDSLPDDYEAPH